jgi:hypothetical protein
MFRQVSERAIEHLGRSFHGPTAVPPVLFDMIVDGEPTNFEQPPLPIWYGQPANTFQPTQANQQLIGFGQQHNGMQAGGAPFPFDFAAPAVNFNLLIQQPVAQQRHNGFAPGFFPPLPDLQELSLPSVEGERVQGDRSGQQAQGVEVESDSDASVDSDDSDGSCELGWCFRCSREAHAGGNENCGQRHSSLGVGINFDWPEVSGQEMHQSRNEWPSSISSWMRRLMVWNQDIFRPYAAFAQQRDGLIHKVLNVLDGEGLLPADHLAALKELFCDANIAVLQLLRALSNDMDTFHTAIESDAADNLATSLAIESDAAVFGPNVTGNIEEMPLVTRADVTKSLLDTEDADGEADEDAVEILIESITRQLEAYGSKTLKIRAQQVKTYHQWKESCSENDQRGLDGLFLPAQIMPQVEGWIVLDNREYMPDDPLNFFKWPDLQNVIEMTGILKEAYDNENDDDSDGDDDNGALDALETSTGRGQKPDD